VKVVDIVQSVYLFVKKMVKGELGQDRKQELLQHKIASAFRWNIK
jgi:hypothetical protein